MALNSKLRCFIIVTADVVVNAVGVPKNVKPSPRTNYMELSKSPKARRNYLIKKSLFILLSVVAVLMGVAVIWLYLDKFGL